MESANVTVTIVCAGNSTLDRIWQVAALPRPGDKIRSLSYLEVGGGQAANAAVTIARLGGKASLVSAVGADTVGTIILAQLRAEHVDASHVQVIDGARSISSAILVETSGERAIIGDVDPELYIRAAAADLGVVRNAAAVLADVNYVGAAERVLGEARRSGVPAVLDIEPKAPAIHARLCPLADHAIFSQAGLAAYTGTDDPEAGLQVAFGRIGGPGRVVGVTLGADGVRLMTARGAVSLPAPKVDAVDTTGAGDAFHGAYALAIGEGQDFVAAAKFASAVAALKCTKAGGRAGLPGRAEVERFMRGV